MRSELETICDFLIQELWESYTDAIIIIRLGGAEVDTYKQEPMDNILSPWDNQNKNNRVKHFCKQRKLFPQVPLLVGGTLGK